MKRVIALSVPFFSVDTDWQEKCIQLFQTNAQKVFKDESYFLVMDKSR